MALYDSPPSIDPKTGRLPNYKQVLQQDPATGVYKIMYEYTPIDTTAATSSLQEMLTTPIDVFPNLSTGIGRGPEDDDETEDMVSTQTTTTGGPAGGGGEGMGRDRGDTPVGIDTTTPAGMMTTAYPGMATRIGVGFVTAALPTLAGIAFSGLATQSRRAARADLQAGIESGLLTANQTLEQIAIDQEQAQQIALNNPEDQLAQDLAAYYANINLTPNIPQRRPTQPPNIEGITSTSVTDVDPGVQSLRDAMAADISRQTSVPGVGTQTTTAANAANERDFAIAAGDVTTAMRESRLNSGYSGMSRDSAQAAENTAGVAAAENSEAFGYGENTTGTDRRSVENEGRNDDGTAEPGSVADMRDRAAQEIAEEGRQVDRDNAVSNTARQNEVRDRDGNAVTGSNNQAVNTISDMSQHPNENARRQHQRQSGGDRGGDKIVCTMMNEAYGFGSFRNRIWLKYAKDNLSDEYQIGYHKLFLPLVNYAKGNKLSNLIVKKILEHIARHRTLDIRQEMKNSKRHTLGKVYRNILEPLCYIVGKREIKNGKR